MARYCCSFKRHDVLILKQLCKAACVKVSASDHEAAYARCINRLLALLLEFEADFVLDHLFDWLG